MTRCTLLAITSNRGYDFMKCDGYDRNVFYLKRDFSAALKDEPIEGDTIDVEVGSSDKGYNVCSYGTIISHGAIRDHRQSDAYVRMSATFSEIRVEDIASAHTSAKSIVEKTTVTKLRQYYHAFADLVATFETGGKGSEDIESARVKLWLLVAHAEYDASRSTKPLSREFVAFIKSLVRYAEISDAGETILSPEKLIRSKQYFEAIVGHGLKDAKK